MSPRPLVRALVVPVLDPIAEAVRADIARINRNENGELAAFLVEIGAEAVVREILDTDGQKGLRVACIRCGAERDVWSVGGAEDPCPRRMGGCR